VLILPCPACRVVRQGAKCGSLDRAPRTVAVGGDAMKWFWWLAGGAVGFWLFWLEIASKMKDAPPWANAILLAVILAGAVAWNAIFAVRAVGKQLVDFENRLGQRLDMQVGDYEIFGGSASVRDRLGRMAGVLEKVQENGWDIRNAVNALDKRVP
jgi:hypothetical protein